MENGVYKTTLLNLDFRATVMPVAPRLECSRLVNTTMLSLPSVLRECRAALFGRVRRQFPERTYYFNSTAVSDLMKLEFKFKLISKVHQLEESNNSVYKVLYFIAHKSSIFIKWQTIMFSNWVLLYK